MPLKQTNNNQPILSVHLVFTSAHLQIHSTVWSLAVKAHTWFSQQSTRSLRKLQKSDSSHSPNPDIYEEKIFLLSKLTLLYYNQLSSL